MRRTLNVFIALCLSTAAATSTASAQRANQADLRILSAALGYGAARITGLGTTPDRAMQGFYIRTDVHILSLILRNLPVATYDALYVDLTYGKMTSDPLTYLNMPEGTSNLVYSAGYTFLAGVRKPSLAVLGGLSFQTFTHFIGDSEMDGHGTPVTARVELGSRRKIVLMGWGGSGMLGGRIDVPLFRRLNATASYWQADGTAKPWDTGVNTPATANMLIIGFRTAEVR
jgi:hypothetical protein